MGLAEALMMNLKKRLASLELVPGTGGRFEVTIDGNLVWSKLAKGEFPDEMEIVKAAMNPAR